MGKKQLVVVALWPKSILVRKTGETVCIVSYRESRVTCSQLTNAPRRPATTF